MYTVRTDAEKRKLLGKWSASGLSLTRFAQRNRVSPASLRQWQQRLGRVGVETQFVDVEVVEIPMVCTSGFVVQVSGGGHRVEVSPGFDAGELRRLVDALC